MGGSSGKTGGGEGLNGGITPMPGTRPGGIGFAGTEPGLVSTGRGLIGGITAGGV